MYVKYYSVKMQQKLAVGILRENYSEVAKWFLKFCSKEKTILKVELSSIDIEKIGSMELFYKGDLESCEYSECYLIDILDSNIYIPNKFRNIVMNQPILLRRTLTHDSLHTSFFCFKGTYKALRALLETNNLPWTTKAMRTKEENKIISSMKNKRGLQYYDLGRMLYDEFDYELIDTIYDLETMEKLLHDFEKIASMNSDYEFIRELLAKRYIEFTEQTEQDANSYLEDYYEGY